MLKIVSGVLIGFVVATGITLLVYFTVIKNKMCTGEFVKCPNNNIEICAEKGTNAGQFCPPGKTGGFVGSINLKQNNPRQIASDMTRMFCGGSQVSENSDAVQCALDLSAYENTLQGWPIFGDRTGPDDDYAQDKWCLGLDPGLKQNYDLSAYTPGSCP